MVVLAGLLLAIPTAGGSSADTRHHERAEAPEFGLNILYVGFGGKGVIPIIPAFFYERSVAHGFSLGAGLGKGSISGPTFASATGFAGYRWPWDGEHAAITQLGGKYVCIEWDHSEQYGDTSDYPGCEDNFLVLGALGYEYRATFFFRALFVPHWLLHQETSGDHSHLLPSHPSFWGELDIGVAF